MNPTSRHSRLSCLAALGALLVITTAGCGGSDDAESSNDKSSSSAPGAADAPGVDATGDTGEAMEDALDAVGDDGISDILGQSLVTVLEGASDYTFADGRLTVEMEGSASDESSACLIATTARDGVGSTAPITLKYADGDVECP